MDSARPNILLIIADDHRGGELSALGSPAQTPYLDQLIAQGTTFTRVFTTVPICTPARAELLTGCNAVRAGVPWFGMPIEPELALLPRTFHDAGYHTGFVGKWHNDGHPRDRGFDWTRRVFHNDSKNHYETHGHTLRFEEETGSVEGYSSDLFADSALEFLENETAGDTPWFLYVGFHSPHDPRTPPEEFAKLYDPEKVAVPPNFMPVHPFDNGAMAIRDELLDDWPRTPQSVQQHLADYYGMISELDAHIGSILDKLEATGQAENTIVLYLADHGLAVGNHGLMGKENLYDHSVRVPLIWRGPGIVQNQKQDGKCCSFDVFPTLCELAQIEMPPTIEGQSLAPALHAETTPNRPTVFGAFTDVMRSARSDRWKLIGYPQIGKWQLFDLETDPHETLDLMEPWLYEPWRYAKAQYYTPVHDKEAMQTVATDLYAQLAAWQKNINDTVSVAPPVVGAKPHA